MFVLSAHRVASSAEEEEMLVGLRRITDRAVASARPDA